MEYRIKAMFKLVGLFVSVYVAYIRYTAGQCVCETDSIDITNRQQIISLGQDDEDAFIFVHISDLHISHYTANDRYEQLNEFCSVNLKAIVPGLVLASGDLTDSVAPGKILVTQFIEEWQMYKDVYTKCQNESGVAHWLDLRGNHDNFNVDGYNSSNSYYPQFGSQRKNPGSYMTIINTNERTKYAFIAVDATLEIGPKRLLNFVGQLDDNRLSKLEEFDKIATQLNVNGTIWFGHYPSSCIFNSGLLELRQVASKGIAYLCGHLHNFVGFVPEMYSRHDSGMLELELADWKDNRMYRVAVLDKGLFSFADVQHKTWPIIVVSNPKPLLTVQCCQQPTEIMATSTHIRIFIFSPSPIEVCEVRLDNGAWEPCKLTGQKNPLYTAPWQPELYAIGPHTLEVRAKDSSGSKETTEIEFALDKTISPHFSWRAKIALMRDFTTMSKWLFGVSIFFSTVPFGIMHLLQSRIILGERSPERVKYACLKLLLRKFWVFTGIKKLFYPILAYTLYLCVGPWLAGYLIDDRIGVVFAWGTFFQDGIFLKGTTTYLYCGIHIILFNGPLICILAHTADVRFQETIIRNRAYSPTLSRIFMLHVPILSFLAFHLATCLLFMHSYGWFTLLLNPARFWSLFLSLYLWWKAKTLNSLDFTNVAKTWN